MNDGDHPYRVPSSNVVAEQAPVSFTKGTLTVARLKTAAVLAVLYALLTIPVTYLSFLSRVESGNLQFEIASKLLTSLSFMLGIYLMLLFKSFVNLRLEFHRVDRYVNVTIGLSVLMWAFMIFMDRSAKEMTTLEVAYLALLVPYGIFSALLGWRLRFAPYYRGVNFFAWINILAGACTASVVLILVVVPLSLLYGIAMAVVFSAAANELSLQYS